MWTRFNVRFEFLSSLCAGIPADPDLQKKWLESRKPKTRPPMARSIDEIAEEVAASTLTAVAPPEESETLLVFQRHDGALAVGMRTIRAHIKDCVGILSSLYVGKVEGEKSFAVRAKNALYYPPEIYWVPILDRDGAPFTAPTGIADKAVRFMTRMGPMSAIKTREFVMDAVIEFPLLVLTQPSGKLVVSEADLKTIFMYGSTHGYGPERSDGEGRYAFSIAQAT